MATTSKTNLDIFSVVCKHANTNTLLMIACLSRQCYQVARMHMVPSLRITSSGQTAKLWTTWEAGNLADKQRILGILATVKEISIELGKTAPVVTLSALDIVTSIISEKQEKGCEPFRNLHHAFLANLEMPATAFYKHVCPIAQQSATLTLVDLFLSQDRDTADWPSPNIQAGHWVSADCVTFAASRQQPHRQSIVLVLPMFVKARSIVFDWSAYLLRLAREELGKAGPSGLYRVFAFSERYKGDLERFFGGLHAHVLANRRSDGDAMNFLGPLSRKPTIILMLPKAWVQLGEAAVRNTTSLNETAGFAFDIKVEQSATSCSD